MIRLQELLNDLGYKNYDSYLSSRHWQDFKEKYRVSKMPKKCLVCGDRNFILHHISYECLGWEAIDDVIPVCNQCHITLHQAHRDYSIPLEYPEKALQQVFAWSNKEVKRRFVCLEQRRKKQRITKRQEAKQLLSQIQPIKQKTSKEKKIYYSVGSGYDIVQNNIIQVQMDLANGLTTKQIADKLDILENYVVGFIKRHSEFFNWIKMSV